MTPSLSRLRPALQAFVLALVVAGTSAFTVLHKTVTVEVDGERSTVSAFGRTVADVLEEHGVAVSERDLVSPAPEATVASGTEIVVRHGREVELEVDGEVRTVWTTAQTVDEVLADLGLREQVRTSASRSSALGRDVLRLSTEKSVHLAVDGESREVVTSASTVREVLREEGVTLDQHDQVSVALDAAVVDGLLVRVSRAEQVTVTETTTQPFATVREETADLPKGTEVVAVAGREGVRQVTYTAHLVGGAEVSRVVLAEVVVDEPQDAVVRVGTRELPATPAAPTAPAVEPGTSRAIGLEMTLARGWGEDQFACLDALWTKESGWRVNAANPSSGAYGIPQSLPGSKMASAGADWQTNPATQISWGLGYIAGRYGTPCAAWAHSQARNWY